MRLGSVEGLGGVALFILVHAALEGAHLPYEEAMSRKYSAYEEARASADFIEGPRAFSEKRKPVWQGS